MDEMTWKLACHKELPPLGLMADWQIRAVCTMPGYGGANGYSLRGGSMIEPFTERVEGSGIVSYGLSSMGYDVRSGTKWKLFSDHLGGLVDVKAPSEKHFQNFELAVGECFILPPNSYALTHSVEYFRMPHNVLGICLGKSTYARVGVHVNVTPLEPGWEGQITIEVSNGTRLPVALYAGEGIMQVLFFAGAPVDQAYDERKGKYQSQMGVTPEIVR